jgi:hypothetical protein
LPPGAPFTPKFRGIFHSKYPKTGFKVFEQKLLVGGLGAQGGKLITPIDRVQKIAWGMGVALGGFSCSKFLKSAWEKKGPLQGIREGSDQKTKDANRLSVKNYLKNESKNPKWKVVKIPLYRIASKLLYLCTLHSNIKTDFDN